MSKPRKKSHIDAIAALPAVSRAIEDERSREQREWVDATAEHTAKQLGLSYDIAFVAASHARETYTAERRARHIAEILSELQAYNS